MLLPLTCLFFLRATVDILPFFSLLSTFKREQKGRRSMKTQGNFNRDKISIREGEETVHTGGKKGGETGLISLKGDRRLIIGS